MRLVPAGTEQLKSDDVVTVRIPEFDAGMQVAEPRVLDLDVETIAAGFADPNWVPQKITCVAYSWIGENEVTCFICGPLGLFGRPELRREMLAPLLDAIAEADYVTGHNLERFDLGVINADAMRLDLPPIVSVQVQDTMRVMRAKGFKKGQDNMGRLFHTLEQKLSLDWQAWQDAYDEVGPVETVEGLERLLNPNVDAVMWPTIRDRAVSDVIMHKQLRNEVIKRGILKKPRMWRATT